MKRLALPLLILLVVLLLTGCEIFDPQWMGIWVDEDTVEDVVITFDFDKWEGTVTVENNAPGALAWLTIVEGILDGDEDTLIATIKSIYQENLDQPTGGDPLIGPMLLAYVITPASEGGLGLSGLDNAVSYKIDGDTIALVGQLILVLTNNESDTLTAVR